MSRGYNRDNEILWIVEEYGEGRKGEEMKVRDGFVSNSSSSSFLIYGAYVDNEEIKEKFLSFDGYSIDKEFGERLRELGLTCVGYYENDNKAVGVSWDEVKDDETGLQFKKRVYAALRELLGRDVECSTIAEAWYDG